MRWAEVDQAVRGVVEGHFRQLDTGLKTKKTSRLDPESSPDITQQFSLGFTLDSVDSISIGELSHSRGFVHISYKEELTAGYTVKFLY